MRRIFALIWAMLVACTKCLFYPVPLEGCCIESIGDHPDIESALRSGYPENFYETASMLCPGCQSEINHGDNVKTDCGLKICRDCIELCEGCEAKVNCEVCSK